MQPIEKVARKKSTKKTKNTEPTVDGNGNQYPNKQVALQPIASLAPPVAALAPPVVAPQPMIQAPAHEAQVSQPIVKKNRVPRTEKSKTKKVTSAASAQEARIMIQNLINYIGLCDENGNYLNPLPKRINKMFKKRTCILGEVKKRLDNTKKKGKKSAWQLFVAGNINKKRIKDEGADGFREEIQRLSTNYNFIKRGL